MNLYKLIIVVVCFLFVDRANAQIITTVAGNGMASGPLGDGGPATAANFTFFSGVAVDKLGNIYIPDGSHYRVRKVDAITGIITTIAGTGIAGYNGDGIPATTAQIGLSGYICLDNDDNVIISDGNNPRIRRINSVGIINTIIGNGVYAYSPDGTSLTSASVLGGVYTFDNNGILFFNDQKYPDTSIIRKVDLAGTLSSIAGIGISGISGDGGAATAAKINGSMQLCTDRHKNVYFTDDYSKCVRKINVITGIITRVAGTGDSVGSPYSGEGAAATNAHISPEGIVIDSFGNIYIGDALNNRIEKIDTFGIIHTIAGTGVAGFAGDNGPATAAKFNLPRNLALDPCGNLYIADANNKRVRRISHQQMPSITISGPSTTSLGSTVTLTASVTNAGYSYSIKWYNKGILFNTTSVPTVNYTKTMVSDSITAKVFGCSDSSLSQLLVVWDTHVGLGSFEQGGVSVFPNPVGDVLYVSGVRESAVYAVSELTGRQVLCGVLQPGDNLVNVASLSSGVYFLQLQYASGQRMVYKVVKA